MPADMSKPDRMPRAGGGGGKNSAAVDILVNNAGIQHVAPVEEFPVEKWDAIIAINLSSAFHTTAAALPLMKKAGSGDASSTSPPRTGSSPRRSNRPMSPPSTALWG